MSTTPTKPTPPKKKSKAAMIRELSEIIYARVMSKKSFDLYELIMEAQRANDKEFSLREAGELFKKASHQIADMAIVAADCYYSTWQAKKGKYLEKTE